VDSMILGSLVLVHCLVHCLGNFFDDVDNHSYPAAMVGLHSSGPSRAYKMN